MRKAILYIRVSTDEQADKGYSLAHQEERLRKYCELQGIQVTALYQDDHSAKNFQRPEFSKLLAQLKKSRGCASLLLFTKWDRFSRNAGDAYGMISQLNRLGVEPQAIEQPLDLNIPENKIMLAFYLAAPEVENDRRALNTLVGMRRAKKEGRWVSTAPRGYKNVRDEHNRPVIVPDENAKYVREGFEELAKGIYAVEEIWKGLTKKGFRCSRNNFWSLIRNPIYMGKIKLPAYRDEEEQIVNGKHEAIIPESLFYEVQDVLDGRRRNIPKKNSKKEEFPLRGFLTCPRCGKNLTASTSNGNGGKYHYYHCTKQCKERIKADIVNRRFLDVLLTLTSNPAVIDYYEAEMKEKLLGNVHEQKRLLRKIQEEIETCKEKIKKARNLRLEGEIDAADFVEIKKEYEPEIVKLSEKQSEIASMNSYSSRYAEFGFHLLRNLDKYYETADIEAKQKLVGLIFPEKMIFENNQFRTKRLRKAVELICRKANDLDKKKVGLPLDINSQSHMVDGAPHLSNSFLDDLRLIKQFKEKGII
jgi:site-specific DNA recombinase